VLKSTIVHEFLRLFNNKTEFAVLKQGYSKTACPTRGPSFTIKLVATCLFKQLDSAEGWYSDLVDLYM
jgi:hypothetical protein